MNLMDKGQLLRMVFVYYKITSADESLEVATLRSILIHLFGARMVLSRCQKPKIQVQCSQVRFNRWSMMRNQ